MRPSWGGLGSPNPPGRPWACELFFTRAFQPHPPDPLHPLPHPGPPAHPVSLHVAFLPSTLCSAFYPSGLPGWPCSLPISSCPSRPAPSLPLSNPHLQHH